MPRFMRKARSGKSGCFSRSGLDSPNTNATAFNWKSTRSARSRIATAKKGSRELDFVEHPRLDTERMLADLCAFVEAEIANAPLRSLVQRLLNDHAPIIKRLPGSVRHYYSFAGGWLEHTLNVVGSCAMLADRYVKQFPDLKPPLNRDIVLASAVLHDIGRVHDIQLNAPGLPAERGVAGELFGHLYLAFDMIREAARDTRPQSGTGRSCPPRRHLPSAGTGMGFAPAFVHSRSANPALCR